MSSIAGTIYRVHLEGLNPTEKSIFGGVLRLAERNGTFFQVEPVLENSDVVILDGSDQNIVEFGKLNSHIAQRAIWIDPPADLHPPRQINRPLHWSSLLDLMEQIVSGNHKDPVAVPGQATAGMTLDQLCSLSENILRKHIGVASQFVMEDVRAEMPPVAGIIGPVESRIFLELLNKQLPATADSKTIFSEISAVIK